MDNKQMPDDKIAAEELLSDSELDSVAGGNQFGQTGSGNEFVPSSQTNYIDLTNGMTGLG